MSKFKFYTALFAANMIDGGLRLMSRSSGTALPGLIGLNICPEFISLSQKYAKEGIINITGTNGKTTTAGLFAAILKEKGKKVLHNEKGANMLTGIASALISGVGFNRKNDYFVLETDEAYLTKLYNHIKADYLLVTNLFRDQLDRYGELDTTYKKINEAILKNKDLNLVLNGDDPMVASLGENNHTVYYGFDDINFMFDTVDAKAPSEAVNCKKCGKELQYDKRFYAHIGDYHCSCGYKRPELKYKATGKIHLAYSEIEIETPVKKMNFKVMLPGLYNIYNALGAIALALELKIDEEIIQKAFDNYHSVFGRAESIKIKGKNALVQLIKNPVGASEVLRLIVDNKKSTLLIVLNDNYADGRDVSWIWDANFEILKDYKQKIVVSGQRAYDMAVRLKYAGVDEKQFEVISDLKEAIKRALSQTLKEDTLLILPTYTALLKMQNIIKKSKI